MQFSYFLFAFRYNCKGLSEAGKRATPIAHKIGLACNCEFYNDPSPFLLNTLKTDSGVDDSKKKNNNVAITPKVDDAKEQVAIVLSLIASFV